jgi:hypothetical protein
MCIVNTGRDPARGGPAGRDQDWERRLGLLVRRLPQRLQAIVRGLRRPAARWIRIPAGAAADRPASYRSSDYGCSRSAWCSQLAGRAAGAARCSLWPRNWR